MTVSIPPKIFFVGDNRAGANWGRAASLALRQLLAASFSLHGCVAGDMFEISTAETAYVGTFLPPKHARRHLWLLARRQRWPFSWYAKVEEIYGAKDFIEESPAASVNNLMRYKSRYPRLAAIYDQMLASDLLVLDGDGDIIFSTPPRRQTLFLLAMIELGLRLGKPTFLVNSMISDCPQTGKNQATLAAARRLLSQCRAVSLRDPESLEYVQSEMPEVRASCIPDSLFSWFRIYADDSSRPPRNGDFLSPFPEKIEDWGRLDFSVPYICIGGGALAAATPEKAVERYSRLVDAVQSLGYRVYLTENDIPDSFLRHIAREKNLGLVPVDAPVLLCGAVLAHATLFISGRYHPSIFASLGGTPCICLGSHAHKMGSFLRIMEYQNQQQFNGLPSDTDVAAIVSMARELLAQGEPLRERISSVAQARCREAESLPDFLRQHLQDRLA